MNFSNLWKAASLLLGLCLLDERASAFRTASLTSGASTQLAFRSILPARGASPACRTRRCRVSRLLASPTDISMPTLSQTGGGAKDAFISSWKLREGSRVQKGEILFVVESDKADIDVEAPHDGILEKILVGEGVRVQPGCVVARLSQNADSTSSSAAQEDAVVNPGQMPGGTVSIFMPALSSTMTSGVVSSWLKKEGDKVEVGDRILVVESDKADMEVEAFDAGFLAGIQVQQGEAAAVGATIAYIVSDKEDVARVREALKYRSAAALKPTESPPTKSTLRDDTSAKSETTETDVHQTKTIKTTAEGSEAEEAAMTAASQWISPSVDQTSSEQPLPGVSHEQLQTALRHRLSSAVPSAAEGLNDPQISGPLFERMKYRPPPRTALVASPFLQGQGEGKDARSAKKTPVSFTPAAEELAKKHGVSLKNLKGSGFAGRVTLEDVKRHLGQPTGITETKFSFSTRGGKDAASEESTNRSLLPELPERPTGRQELSALEKAISKNMEATVQVPVFRVTRGIQMENLLELVRQLKAPEFATSIAAASEFSEEWNDFVLPNVTTLLAKATALAIRKHPLINSRFDAKTQEVIHPESVDVAVAVSIPRGLVTPVLRECDRRNVFSISQSWKRQLAAAQRRDFAAADLTGGTFFISNLGMSGVRQFDAVLPQNVGCIMAVGAVETKAKPKGSAFEETKEMEVTLTCDHRHIYGQHAADFLQASSSVSSLFNSRLRFASISPCVGGGAMLQDFAALLEKSPAALLVA